MPKCKSCGADIKWVRTLKGKAMPVDAKPILVMTEQETEGPVRFRYFGPMEGYVSHFATCPNADKHRKKRG